MSDPLRFQVRRPTPEPPPSAELAAAASGTGYRITLTLGPFIVGGAEPDWVEAAALVIAECRREWTARNAPTPPPTDPSGL